VRSPKTTTDWPVAAFLFRGCALYGAAPHLPLGETRDGFNEGAGTAGGWGVYKKERWTPTEGGAGK